MVIDGLSLLSKRFRPSEGWPVFLLLCSAVALLIVAVMEVNWVPEAGVVTPTAVFGLLLGVVLAKRPLSWPWAWLLLFLYALLLTIITLGQLLPPFTVLAAGWEPTRQFWLQNGAEFLTRMQRWFVSVLNHGSSRETIFFAFILGMLSFFLAAYAGWTTFRQQRPLRGLLLMGLALAVNSYFGAVQIWWTGLFVGVAALLTAVVNYARLEEEWNANQVDYPESTYLEVVLYSAVIAASLLAVALFLPTLSISRVQAWFAGLTAVTTAESALGEAFGGVNVPLNDRVDIPKGGVGGSGLLPREYLLSGTPEQLATIMMTAEVFVQVEGKAVPAPPELLRGTHWRALSYDVYTGKGWAISQERVDPVAAFETIPIPNPQSKMFTLSQSIQWLHDNRLIRYSLGLPLTFDHRTTVHYRGLNDLARVRGQGNFYEVTSRLPDVTTAELRQSRLEDVPAALLMRYTELPDSVPDRVYDLAQEIAGGLDNPYDQARAIEAFLRQYPYSLEISSPPESTDPVDYFLFDIQTGYCDYYASSMVMMARTLGIPARLGVGFLAQVPDENGVQTIRHENGHSWAEVYFADIGWVEFEPTAGFATSPDTISLSEAYESFSAGFAPELTETAPPPPIPEPAPARPFPWQRLFFIGIIGLVLIIWWWRGRAETALHADGVIWAYGRLQKSASSLGRPANASQTPAEFSSGLIATIEPESSRVPHDIQLITRLYNRRRYAGHASGGEEEAKRAWKNLKWPFLRLRLDHFFSREKD